MENNEEFRGILANLTAKDLQELLDQLPDAEAEREGLEEQNTNSSDIWGYSGSLKYRRDY